MTLTNAIEAVGGVALFILAMHMMTEGLKAFAGTGLRRVLERWTSSPVRGVAAGALVTGVVQSSSAVIVATIGFVNAGALTLRQGLGVVYGTNVGTTVTGWLVSLVGLGFKIEALALPILSAGVVVRLSAPGKGLRGLGEALAGFGLFFLGLALLKSSFEEIAAVYAASIGGGIAGGWAGSLLAGVLATVLTQSSSAAIAVILTAAAGGVMNLESAAAAVIGANLGTTSTAIFAVIKATPSAKRLAVGHIVFNGLTGLVALALLPLLVALVGRLADSFTTAGTRATELALFHTVFNVIGVSLMLPLTPRLAGRLDRMFRGEEEDLGRPRHLDATLTSTPALAVAALRLELGRLLELVGDHARQALEGPGGPPGALERRTESIRTLSTVIATHVAAMRSEQMTREVAGEFASALRVARFLDAAARLVPGAPALRRETGAQSDPGVREPLANCRARAAQVIAHATKLAQPGFAATLDASWSEFLAAYSPAKTALLEAVVRGALAIEEAGELLDALSGLRRLTGEIVKAGRALRAAGPAEPLDAIEMDLPEP